LIHFRDTFFQAEYDPYEGPVSEEEDFTDSEDEGVAPFSGSDDDFSDDEPPRPTFRLR